MPKQTMPIIVRGTCPQVPERLNRLESLGQMWTSAAHYILMQVKSPALLTRTTRCARWVLKPTGSLPVRPPQTALRARHLSTGLLIF